ncbi:MAG: HEPN domain-containing protein [bacterium]|nr:HEPN domain-containing protein [bacterium]
MKQEDRDALIQHRMKNAYDTLEQAKALYNINQYLGVVNRAYYSMFYASIAILLTKGLGSSKHKGVLSLFDKEFVKLNEVDVKWSKILHHGFERRNSSDYDDWVSVEKEEPMNYLGMPEVLYNGHKSGWKKKDISARCIGRKDIEKKTITMIAESEEFCG